MTAIEFENISKQYRLGLVSTRTLSHDLNRWWRTRVLRQEDPYLKIGSVNDRETKADSDYVWALKDINLKIEQGDVVGIIGRNGAGKSTLLKLLSRVTNPTTGTIRARGRIASLLEVGTGFHPELTGRENIYMNGAIMGMSKGEITRKLDEIVDFSGCERYIDTPVKRYSSGMTVRLGFAVAAHLDPDILVVDEVLAVGDAGFQKKAIGKMQDVSKEEGRTVLFVSHNMASMMNLCKRGVLLDRGCVIYTGGIMDTVDMYTQGADKGKIHYNNSPGEARGCFRFRSARVRRDGLDNFDVIDVFDRISLRVDYELTQDDAYKSIAVFIEKDGVTIATLLDTTHRPDLLRERRKGFYSMEFDLPCPLLKPGRYTVTVKYTRPRIDDFVVWRDCLRFEVGLLCTDGTDSGYAGNYTGMVAIDPALRIERVER